MYITRKDNWTYQEGKNVGKEILVVAKNRNHLLSCEIWMVRASFGKAQDDENTGTGEETAEFGSFGGEIVAKIHLADILLVLCTK